MLKIAWYYRWWEHLKGKADVLPPIFGLILAFKEKSEEAEVGDRNRIVDEMQDLSCFSC